jgi:hypothetical protein
VCRWTRTGYEASTRGRVGNEQQSPYPSKASVGKSGGGALKAVELTTGGLLHVVETRLEKKRFFLNVQQKSAEGIVVRYIGRRPER